MLGNGSAFRAFVAESVAALQDVKAIDYYQRPLPDELDNELFRVVTMVRGSKLEERMVLFHAFDEKQRSLFGIFGHRMATRAVRQMYPDFLMQGLVGAVIANFTIPDRRNVEVSLAVYHHCARKLGVNTVDLFDEAAQFASEEFAHILRQYGRRSDVTLRKYGWREIKTPDGVKYKFDW
jgi:hypothetical protein